MTDKKKPGIDSQANSKTHPNHNILFGLLALLASLSAIAAELALWVMLGVLIWSL